MLLARPVAISFTGIEESSIYVCIPINDSDTNGATCNYQMHMPVSIKRNTDP